MNKTLRITVRLAAAFVACAALAACASPFGAMSTGTVDIDFGSASGSREARALPPAVSSIEIRITASDMPAMVVALESPSLSASVKVKAGAARTFDVSAYDAGAGLIYQGSASMDIVAGATHSLSVSMDAVFAIKYHGNGETGGSAPPSQYGKVGDPVTVAGNTGNLVKTDYAFSMWNAASNGSSYDYSPGQVIAMPSGGLDMYAMWTPTGSAKDITAFSIPSEAAIGVISGTSIAVSVAFGAPVASLAPSITHTGASVSPASGLAQDFTSPVDYTVTALDGSTKVYTVTVTVLPDDNAQLAAGGLVVSSVSLSPAFDPGLVSYSTVAPANSAVPSVTVTPTVAAAGATVQVQINGGGYTLVASGTPSGALVLNHPAGTNTIEVLVTAADAVTTKTYTVTIAKTVMVTITPGAGGAVSPASGEYTPGAVISLTATPNPGYRFIDWTGTASVAPVNMASANLTVGVSSQATNANFLPFNGGDGSVGTPYLIATVAQLKLVNSFLSSNFRLVADLDLISEANWTPLGNSTTKFTGSFDGNFHTLDNLTIDTPIGTDRGLFGYVNGAIIYDLYLTDINFVDTFNYAGGLIGTTIGATLVTGCSVTGTITAYQSAGGLIGFADTGSSLSVTDCWTNVTINSDIYGNLGGLIGDSRGGSVTRCYALGAISESSGFAVDQVGGLIGNSENTTVTDSYARGSVAGDNNVGGLIGYNSASNVTNSYSSGAVTCLASNPGGLIGFNTASTITSGYYDTDVSGQSDNTGKGIPLSSALMKAAATAASTYSGWDFGSVWTIVDGQYPTLQ